MPDDFKRTEGFDGDDQSVIGSFNTAEAGFIEDFCHFMLAVQMADDKGDILAVLAVSLRVGDKQAVGKAGIERDGIRLKRRQAVSASCCLPVGPA